MFSSEHFVALLLTFRRLTYFELLFAYGVRKGSLRFTFEKKNRFLEGLLQVAAFPRRCVDASPPASPHLFLRTAWLPVRRGVRHLFNETWALPPALFPFPQLPAVLRAPSSVATLKSCCEPEGEPATSPPTVVGRIVTPKGVHPSPPELVIRLPYMATGTFVGVIKVKKLEMGAGPGSPRGPSVITRVLPSGRGESERET